MSESENFNILEGENDLSLSKEVCGISAKISNNPKPKNIDEEEEEEVEDIIYAKQEKQISPTNVNKYNEKNKAKNNKEESDDAKEYGFDNENIEEEIN